MKNINQLDQELRQPFLTHCFTVVICRNHEGKWLCVKETKNRGLWVPGGLVPPGEYFKTSAIQKTKLKTNIDIELTGILRIEHNNYGKQSSRMRVIFFAIPTCNTNNNSNSIKTISDGNSEGALWLTLEEIKIVSETKVGIRGPEVIDWPSYIENGGLISPLELLVAEEEKIQVIKLRDNNADKGKDKEIFKDKERFVNTSQNSVDKDKSEYNLIESLINDNLTQVKNCLIFGGSNLDLNISINTKGWRPLHYGIITKNEELVKLLLISDNNTNPSILEVYTLKLRNCLHFAVLSTTKILNSILIKLSFMGQKQINGIINLQDLNGDTPLHLYLKNILNNKENMISNRINTGNMNKENKQVFNAMIELGARLDIKNNEGLSCNMFNITI